MLKNVKTREAPPEVAADLADEFGDKGEPEEEEEPVEMKESSEGWDDLLANIMNHSSDANAAGMAEKAYDLVEAGDIEGATDLIADIMNHTSDPDTSEMAERAYAAVEAAGGRREEPVVMKDSLDEGGKRLGRPWNGRCEERSSTEPTDGTGRDRDWLVMNIWMPI